MKRVMLVAGAGELGIRVAEHLVQHHEEVILVAKNERQLERASDRGLTAVIGRIDIDDPRLSPYFEDAQSVVCVYNDIENSYQVAKLARQVYGVDHVVARVDDPQEMSRFTALGVVSMNIALDRAAMLALLVRNPGMYDLLTRTDDDKDIGEVRVKNPAHFGKRVRDLNLPGEVLILALHRDGEYLIPTGDTQLEADDKLSLLGKITCIEDAKLLFR